MVDKGRIIQQRTPPWWSRSPVSSGMAIGFPAAPPRQPLRKGLTKGGVEGFNYSSVRWKCDEFDVQTRPGEM